MKVLELWSTAFAASSLTHNVASSSRSSRPQDTSPSETNFRAAGTLTGSAARLNLS